MVLTPFPNLQTNLIVTHLPVYAVFVQTAVHLSSFYLLSTAAKTQFVLPN